jgi:hypothetical protein
LLLHRFSSYFHSLFQDGHTVQEDESVPDTSHLVIYPVPQNAPKSPDYELWVNDQPVHVYDCEVAAYAIFACSGPVQIIAHCRWHANDTTLKPQSLGIAVTWNHDMATFTLPFPRQVVLDVPFPERKPLFIYAHEPEISKPDPHDPKVRYFEAGRMHDAGAIKLGTGETLYIEGGAYVRGLVESSGASDVRVCGHGVIDGGIYRQPRQRFCYFGKCRNVEICGITMVHTPGWIIELQRCKGVHVHHVNQIGWYIGSDGIDVVASHNVLIDHCCLRNNDDCIAIKANAGYRVPIASDDPSAPVPQTVENVEVRDCTFFNALAGNVMEIGYELTGETVRGIVFRNNDVIAAHGEGGVFTIHNGDHALIENILYEDIRIEHYYDKLIDFRILKSRYSKDAERGHIRNVTIRNVMAVANRYNSVSLIGGYDAEHIVENIRIENITFGGDRVRNAGDLHLFTNDHVRNITIA